MTQETLKKLAQLLEQDQFELILPENVQPDETKIEGEGTRGRDIRLVYLMNDAAESFLVFRNARMTGEYHSEYQGQLQASMNRQADGYVPVSYTHLDVYKRQVLYLAPAENTGSFLCFINKTA